MSRLRYFVILSLVGAFGVAAAQDKPGPTPKEKSVPALKPGDPAPSLRASMWLQGEEVKAFESGKVYVIEFWSTTCAPCIALMPHLAELQKRYQDKGVTIIGCTAEAFKDTEEKAAAFVKKRGPALHYRFAFADERSLAAWMTAAGMEAIPCTFVVDQSGQIAYIGNPFYLDFVLEKVVAGKSTAKEIGAEMRKIQDEYNDILGTLNRGPGPYLQAIKDFEAKYPALTDLFPSVKSKLSFLPKYGKPGEAKKYAQELLAKAIEREDRMVLSLVSALLRQGDAKGDKDLLALAVKAAEAEVRITGGKDAEVLISLAEVHFVSGDTTKAREVARQAVKAAAAESDALKQRVAEQAKRFGEGAKDMK
jgi:thiol-disulfide isomerase/thioredoxin